MLESVEVVIEGVLEGDNERVSCCDILLVMMKWVCQRGCVRGCVSECVRG